MLIAGVGNGFVVPATNMMVARLTPHRAAAALGALNLCWGIGAATWPVIVARFNPVGPVSGARLALLLASLLLFATAVRTSFARFPRNILRHVSGATPGVWSWRRLTVFGLCMTIYSGVESAFGGWITEYTRRLTVDTSTMRWETAASAFWGGLAGGRGLVATALAPRFENAALFAGLVLVATAIGTLLVVSGVVAGTRRRGGVRARPRAGVPGDDGGAGA